MIPKIIWQTHEKKYSELPGFQKNIINTWKNLNPGWEHRYVDAEERAYTVKNYNDFIYQCYLESDKLHQSDIWRFIAIYNHGGFYADMDSTCIQTIQDVIYPKYESQDAVCSPIGFQHYGVNCSNFGAVKNSKLIKLVIDSLILQYNDIKIENIKNFPFAVPENLTFSLTAKKNKEIILFNKDYFSHSSDYKKSFDTDINVIFKGKEINYETLCKNNNWPIYYI
jgi:hypothetical protein